MTRFCALTSALWLVAAPAFAQEAGPRVFEVLPVVPPGTPLPEPEPQDCGDALCERLAEQLAQGCGGAGDVPYADTIFLRRGIDPGIGPELTRAITLALASNDPATARRLIGPFLAAEPAAERYTAGLYLALVQVQAGAGLGEAEDAIGAMRDAAPEAGVPPSDLHFLEALRALEEGDARAARSRLAEAIAAEPRFFNALALALRLDMDHAAAVGRQGASLCEAAYAGLLDRASQMLSLEPCARQAAHLDIYLSRDLANPADSAPYQAVKVYVALLSRRPAIAAAARDRFAAIDGPRCTARIAALLDQLIASTEEP